MTTGKKKFGAFGGVFTPSILTILGVIMYLRLGWVVGNAGLWGAIFIVLLAHVISVTTGLSISSIATDKKVGAGGVYYVLSRSLGLPIGGAIGLTLFIGTALSIALYIVGFSESFNAIIGLDASIDNIRLTGSIALLLLTIIAFISTSLAIKTQYFILAAIFVSLASIFIGGNWIPDIPAGGLTPSPNASFETVFAIFFPAVTGFTAGIAMSGDLKDPKKAIPVGTIAAISVGFIVYIGLTLFLFFKVDAETLKSDYSILEKIAFFSPAVIAGIWGATLSSALGGILGGPRILQAMSLDKITPGIFGKEQGKTKEPRIALIVAILLAESGILIGDLDIVARVVSMFYLAAYGFINISFFLESWASADFRPSFKVNKWFGFIGFLATFGIMFQLDILAMVLALLIIGGIYLWLTRREIALGTGDIWRSVWSTSVKEGLKRLEQKEDHKRNWKPNILLFSGNSEARPHLIEFSQALSGRAGLVTNFDLIENEGMDVLFTKHKQSVKDELLQKYGIFGRRIEVKNVYKGIETIAATFGFSGVDPNTVLMGWARNTQDPIWFAQMTQKLIDLDYNVLYMDYDQGRGFGQREQIDLWWRGISNNAELMLQIAKFISFNADWRKAHIRILLVNDYNVDRRIIENRISGLLEEFRLKAEIKVIDNHIDRKPFYHILKIHSLKSDLVLIGIPHIIEGEEQKFVQNTNDLVEVIGTTLLVKGSTTFDVTQLGLKQLAQQDVEDGDNIYRLPELRTSPNKLVNSELKKLDQSLAELTEEFKSSTLQVIQQHYLGFISELEKILSDPHKEESENHPVESALELSRQFRTQTLGLMSEILDQGIKNYLEGRAKALVSAPAKIQHSDADQRSRTIHWKKALLYLEQEEFPPAFVRALKEFGIISIKIITRSKELVKEFIEAFEQGDSVDRKVWIGKFNGLKNFSLDLTANTTLDIRHGDRRFFNLIVEKIQEDNFAYLWRKDLFQGNRSTNKERKDFIEQFAAFWRRNLDLFHDRFETAIELKRSSTQISIATENLLKRVKRKTTNKILEVLDKTEASQWKEDGFEANLPPMYDYLPDFRSLNKALGQALKNLPGDVVLMDTNSEINIQDNQGKDVETVTFSVDKIAEFLVETRYIAFIHESLENFNKEINSIIGEFILIASDTATSAPKRDEKKILQNIRSRALHSLEVCQAEIRERITLINSQLEVQHIIEQADQLKQYIRKKEIQQGFQGSLRFYRSRFNKQVKKLISWLNQRRENQKQKEFQEQYDDFWTAEDRSRQFMSEICLDPMIRESIPYYYRQLFSGKHLQSLKSDAHRGPEITQLQSFLRNIEKGQNGAMMITGPSLSGKSFLTEKMVNQYIKGKVFYIRPPKGGALHKKDLDLAFRRATGGRGSVFDILEQMGERVIFVFSDLEMWWLNHPGGQSILDHLCDIVLATARMHYFVFNSNIHSLKQMKQNSRLSEVIAGTVVLSPFDQRSLRQEILKRNKTGGLNLIYKGSMITLDREDRAFDRLFDQLFLQSKGNIGQALQLWIRSVSLEEDGRFHLSIPPEASFPDIDDSEWQNLITQLILHKQLSAERLKILYHDMPDEWITQKIHQLKNAALLSNPDTFELSLHDHVRPYIENWLNENNLL
jgi:amino acid transporter